MKQRIPTILKASAISLSLLATGCLAGAQVVVSPSNMQGWSLFVTDDNGNLASGNGDIAQMTTGPATPPLGVGSAQLATPNGTGDTSADITTFAYDNMSLSSLTSLSYFTYDTVNNGQQFPYLALNVSLDGSGGDQDTLFFEPPYQTPGAGNPSLPDQGATVMNTWQSWNAFEGGWWDNNSVFTPGTGVGSLAAFEALNPNATIVAAGDGSPYGGITLQVGYGSPGDTYNGYVDDVTIGTTSGSTTYDFEPVPAPEPTTLALAGLGLGTLLISRRKK